MIRSPINAAAAALLVFGVSAAHAEILHVNVTNLNPAYAADFGGLSFNLNTAATTNTVATGTCASTPGVYTTFNTSGGVSDGSLVWDGATYTLQNAYFNYDLQGGCVYDFNMDLQFSNGTSFQTVDQPDGAGPFLASQYTPSQMLAADVLSTYNAQLTSPFLIVEGQYTGDTGLSATATPVPEPGTFALLAAGLAGLAAVALSKRQFKV
jgi:hypothetical protein